MNKFAPAFMLALYAVPLLFVVATAEGDRLSLADLQAVYKEYDCIGLRGKTDAHTKELLRECRLLMKTKVMKNAREYILKASIEELEEVRRRNHSDAKERVVRSAENRCPVMDEAYLQRHEKEDGGRSLSPFNVDVKYDQNRFPKYIVSAYCLCAGCIDNVTGEEMFYANGLPVHSEQFDYHLDFRYREPGSNLYSVTKRERVGAGCTCQFS